MFAAAFRSGDIAGAGRLYHPRRRLPEPHHAAFGWPRRIEGRDRTLEFIQLTIGGLANIDYALDERAVIAADSAYARILFDFDLGATAAAVGLRRRLPLPRGPDRPAGALLRPERPALRTSPGAAEEAPGEEKPGKRPENRSGR